METMYICVCVCAYRESKEENRNFECQSVGVTQTPASFIQHHQERQYHTLFMMCSRFNAFNSMRISFATWNNFLLQLHNFHFSIFPLMLLCTFVAVPRMSFSFHPVGVIEFFIFCFLPLLDGQLTHFFFTRRGVVSIFSVHVSTWPV